MESIERRQFHLSLENNLTKICPIVAIYLDLKVHLMRGPFDILHLKDLEFKNIQFKISD